MGLASTRFPMCVCVSFGFPIVIVANTNYFLFLFIRVGFRIRGGGRRSFQITLCTMEYIIVVYGHRQLCSFTVYFSIEYLGKTADCKTNNNYSFKTCILYIQYHTCIIIIAVNENRFRLRSRSFAASGVFSLY